MVIVDNGHIIQEDTENGSMAKILKFFNSNKDEVLENEDKEDKTVQPQSLQSFRSPQSRLVVFTDNFLGATHSNDQLIYISEEFDRLKSIYVGNKVKWLQNYILFCPILKFNN